MKEICHIKEINQEIFFKGTENVLKIKDAQSVLYFPRILMIPSGLHFLRLY